MDTRSKKSDKSIITKAICFILAMIIAASGAVYTVTVMSKAYRESGYTANMIYKVFNYGSVENMQKYTFQQGVTSYFSLIESLTRRYQNGSKEKYDEISKEYIGAAENLKKDIIYHVRSDAYEAVTVGMTSYIENILSLYYDGYISLEYIDCENLNLNRYAGDIAEIDVESAQECFYAEFFLDEPDMYYDGSWEEFHSEMDSVEKYENSFPGTVKKAVKNQGFDGAICLNAELFDPSATDETVIHTTLYDGSSYTAPGLESDMVLRGFYGFKVNDKILEEALYDVPYVSYKAFRDEYEEERAYIEGRYKSAYFAAVKDGKVIANNLAGINAESTEADILKAISKYDFQVVIDTECNIIKTQPPFDIELNSCADAGTAYYIGIDPYGSSGFAKDDEVFIEEISANYALQFHEIKNTFSDLFIFVGVCLLLFLVLAAILVIRSGRYKSDDEMHMMPLDGMFFELRTLIDGGLIALLGVFAIENVIHLNSVGNTDLAAVVTAVAAAIITALLLDFILYITRHLKNRTLHTRLILVWAFNNIFKRSVRFIRSRKEKLYEHRDNIRRKYMYIHDVQKNVVVKTLIVIAINLVFGFWAFCLVDWNDEALGLFVFFLLFLFDAYILFRGIRFVGAVKSIFKAVEKIRNGEENVKLEKRGLPSTFHKTADDLMSISDGIKIAVEKAMQNEKMKTELITNVSHDLKTPLTSIINYVDLLQQCDIHDETAQSYLSVLSEKSDRLKHLIEDLVEASKASSGAMNVNLVSVSVNEFINQLMGEHGEGLSERNLTMIVNVTENDIILKADSNLLYRVLENLIVNVKKYAMENTRVYLSTQKLSSTAKITLKNISAAPLNMTPQELMSRFVRGDVSRSTSGNGLGLSIAENLCELMGGKLEISIDGDLFTATVEMPLE